MANRQWKEYFFFSRKERNGVMVLLLLLVLFFMLPRIIPSGDGEKAGPGSDSLLMDNARSLQTYRDTSYRPKEKRYNDFRTRYAERKYYPERYAAARSYREYSYPDKKRLPMNSTRPSVSTVYLNDADTADLLPLPGIGLKLAARIIGFRDKLGGFYDVQQVAETYGLPDSTFRLIKEKLQLGSRPLKQININTADAGELRQHPYIRWQLANAIIAYRAQHGPFGDLQALLKIHVITQEAYTKMRPYLTTDSLGPSGSATHDP